MGWIVCVRCGVDLDENATRCTRCGADPRTGQGAGPRRVGPKVNPLWQRALLYLVASVGVGLVFVFVLRAIAEQATLDIFHTVCIIVGLVTLVSGIGGATGARMGWRNRTWRRAEPSSSLLAVCLMGFGATVLVTGLAVSLPERLDPSSWAGYVSDARPARSVTASWVQPTVTSKAIGYSAVAFWVGLQGEGSDAVEQIGVTGECMDGGEADYQPWYENYPKPAVRIGQDRLLIGAGDRLTATVTTLRHDRYRLLLIDHTTSRHFVTIQKVAGVGDTDAAIQIEAPHGKGQTLAAFTPVRFTACEVDGRPIGDLLPWATDIVIGGVARTDASALNDAGDGFSVTYQR